MIAYPSRRAYLTGPGAGPGGYEFWCDENCQMLTEFGITEVIIPWQTWYDTYPRDLTTRLAWYEPILSNYDDYGIQCSLQYGDMQDWIQTNFNDAWTAADFETYEGDFVDVMNADDRVFGFTIELPNLIGLSWLKGRTRKVLSELCVGRWIIDSAWMLATHNYAITEAQYRNMTTMFDEIILEMYTVASAGAMYSELDYINNYFPDKLLGTQDPTQRQWAGDPFAYWCSYEPLVEMPLTWEDQEARATLWLRALAARRRELYGRGYDFVVTETDGPPDADNLAVRGDSLSECISWREKFNLIDRRYVFPMSHDGTPVHYTQRCSFYDKQVDSFYNTGNEIIVLKNLDYSPSKAYSITVSGYVQTTTYTPTILFGGCAYIGPFEINKYGSRPRVEVDDASLDIAVIKVVPV